MAPPSPGAPQGPPARPPLAPARPSPARASARALTFCTRFRAALKWAIILSTAALMATSRAAGQGRGRCQPGSPAPPPQHGAEPAPPQPRPPASGGSGRTPRPGAAGKGPGERSIPGCRHGNPRLSGAGMKDPPFPKGRGRDGAGGGPPGLGKTPGPPQPRRPAPQHHLPRGGRGRAPRLPAPAPAGHPPPAALGRPPPSPGLAAAPKNLPPAPAGPLPFFCSPRGRRAPSVLPAAGLAGESGAAG